jgi:2-iminobutanoate/2-iminopropanoate deaminase
VKTIVQTEKAPAAIGPYSQAVKAGGFVFLSGQIALDPASGQVVEGDVRAQTERVMQNLEAVLAAAGSSLAAVVKATVFLADMNDFAAMNEVYGRFFSSDPPARATVQAARLPKDVQVEIDLIALAGS